MFFTRLFQLLLGYIRFRVDGASPEKFLNLSARSGITLWNMKRDSTGLCANTRNRGYKHLLPLAEKAGVQISVLKRHGLPARIAKHHARYGFLLGAILFFAMLWYLSGFVWTITVQGNSTVETREILYTLSGLGLKPGVRTDSFKTKSVEQKALTLLPDLSWMHINYNGGAAEVSVGERSSRPEIVPDDRPCNVKATQTGQIISMQIFQGAAEVKPGDTALKGGLLVSGIVQEPKAGVTRYVHARATVIARTKRTLSVTVPFKATVSRDTGHVVKKYTISLLSFELPLYRKTPTGNYRRNVYRNPVTIGSVQLPIALTTSAFIEYKEIPVVYTKEQVQEQAKAQIAAKENTELSNAKIVKKSYTTAVTASGVTLTGHYDCEEDIAYEEEVHISGH